MSTYVFQSDLQEIKSQPGEMGFRNLFLGQEFVSCCILVLCISSQRKVAPISFEPNEHYQAAQPAL